MMTRAWGLTVLSAVSATFFGVSVFAGAAPRVGSTATAWTLAWSDEFNGSGPPSSADWNYHVGNGWNPRLPDGATFDGWGNGEWEWYRPEQCTQQDGALVLRADWQTAPTVIGGRNWYQRSCRITTAARRSFTYGRIEARIRMPNAGGTWPAFWMMGDACDDSSTSAYDAPLSHYDTLATNWASCGEVDIMEHRDSDATIVNNLFWDTRTGLYPWAAASVANYPAFPTVGDVSAFHVYAIEWDSRSIRWFVDDVQTHVIDTTPPTLEEYRRPFHLILNLALGGQLPVQTPEQSRFPLAMAVDYVRYYTAGPLATTATALSASLNASNGAQAVTFTATVSPSSATGVVIFRDGTTTLGVETLAGGTATYTTASLAAGAHSITATYGGDESLLASNSAPLTHVVTPRRRRAYGTT